MEQLTETKTQQPLAIPEGVVQNGVWYINPMPVAPITEEERYDSLYPIGS